MVVQSERPRTPLSRLTLPLLTLILVLAAVPRLMGNSWDGGYYAHPDESHVLDVAANRLQWPQDLGELRDPQTSPMNARRADGQGGHLSYSYGTMLAYAVKGVSSVVARLTGDSAYATMEAVYRVARPMAALADLVTVLCVYLLGRRLWGARAGLLAAAFSAFSMLQVQFSHFYVAEPVMTALLTAALLQIVRALQDRNGRAVVYAGVLMGLAVGVKPSATAFVPAGLAILFAGALATLRPRVVPERRSWLVAAGRGLRLTVVAGVMSVLAWAVCEPYAVLDLRTYVENILAESRIQRGVIDMPFTRQYIGTIPVWYHLSQYVRWGVGLPLGLAAVAGLIWGLYRLLRRDWRVGVLLGWITPYTLSIILLETKWLRYMIPITPVLMLLAAAVLWRFHDRLAAAARPRAPLGRVRPRLAVLAMVAVLAGSGLWVLAWTRIYTAPHNWVVASEWIYGNVEPGQTIGYEHWDTPLPYGLPDQDREQYGYHQIAMYDDLEPYAKLDQVRAALEESDYIVLASNRISDTAPKLPWRYAVAIRYYDLLFEERLGFREVARFSNGPGLGPVEIPSTGADDNVAVYDHPTVRIFRKERDLESWELDALFADALAASWSPERHGTVEKSLMLPPYRDPAQTGLPYFAGVAGSGLGATVLWLLALELLGLAGWLLLRPLLRALPDRGWTAAKLLGIVLLAWPAWLLPAVGLLPSGQGLVWLVAGVLAAAALVAALRRRHALRAEVLAAWRAMLGFELLFLALFGAGALLRAANPDLWQPYFGGEKPMELAFINGILRSSELPPYDPWFAGGYINYYYFGQWIVAALMRLSLVGPQFGFNLAVATMWALTGALAVSLGYNLARQLGRAAGAAVAGLSLALVLLVGNLDGAVQAVQAVRTGRTDLWQSFDFWRSTRLNMAEPGGFIHEFPFFTFLYGDLHAHMIVMPLGLALLSLGAALVLSGGDTGTRRIVLTSALAGVVAGAIATTNPWDAPGYGGLFALALLFSWVCRPGRVGRRVAGALASVLLFGVVAAASYTPFFASFKSFYGEIGVVRDPTPLPVYLNMLGLFLYLVLWYAAARLWPGRAGKIALLLGLAAFGAGFVLGRAVLGLLAGLLVLTLVALWRSRRSAPELVWAGLAAGGLLIWAGIEVLYLRDFLDGGGAYRMNTVFKFGLQSWILLALGCAGLVWLTLSRSRSWLARAAPLAVAVALFAASLLYPVYGTATRLQQRFPAPPPRPALDGEAFLRTARLPNESGRIADFAHDYAAIRWLRENVRAPETLVEASIGPYRGNGGRISMFTGLPALMGWDNHEAQQRYPEQVSERHAAIRELYDSLNPYRALEVISRYGVRYVYVGPVERLHEWPAPNDESSPERYASTAGLVKFDALEGKAVRVAYRNAGVTIYEVLPSWRWRLDGLTVSRGGG